MWRYWNNDTVQEVIKKRRVRSFGRGLRAKLPTQAPYCRVKSRGTVTRKVSKTAVGWCKVMGRLILNEIWSEAVERLARSKRVSRVVPTDWMVFGIHDKQRDAEAIYYLDTRA